MDCGITTEAPSPGMITPPVDVEPHSQNDDEKIRDESDGGHVEQSEERKTLADVNGSCDEIEGPSMAGCSDSGK